MVDNKQHNSGQYVSILETAEALIEQNVEHHKRQEVEVIKISR